MECISGSHSLSEFREPDKIYLTAWLRMHNFEEVYNTQSKTTTTTKKKQLAHLLDYYWEFGCYTMPP